MSRTLAAFCRMDQAVLEARRGDYEGDARRVKQAASPRDLKEQAFVKRMFADPALAAKCAAMGPEEWDAFMDKECGRRPGRMDDRHGHHVEHREPPRAGMVSLFEAAEMIGCNHRSVWGYAVDGVMGPEGERVYLETEKVGRQLWTTREWVTGFLEGAPWVKRADGERRAGGRKPGKDQG